MRKFFAEIICNIDIFLYYCTFKTLSYNTSDYEKNHITLFLCAVVQGAWAQNYKYVERKWVGSDTSGQIEFSEKTANEGTYDVLSGAKYGSGGGLNGIGSGASEEYEFFIVNSNYTINNGLTVKGTCKVILCSGYTLTVKGNGIEVLEGSRLIIYDQTEDGTNRGRLIVNCEKRYNAAIGSKYGEQPGAIEIHGGYVEAHSGREAAGIGGGGEAYGAEVTIYGGTVKAYGGYEAAGIGAGAIGSSNDYDYDYYAKMGTLKVYGGNVYAEGGESGAGIGTGRDNGNVVHVDGSATFYGGKVEAKGGDSGAGIGGGSGNSGMHIAINGGEITASGGYLAAGIGGGALGKGSDPKINAKIIIRGGTIKAYGGKYAAGIGGGCDASGGTVEIYGGDVFTDGGMDAAGIGSGEEGANDIDGGSLTVYGGHVFADGTGWGAGIGGGEDADGANVTIKGGVVEAYAGSDAGEKNGSAIGTEDGDGHRGSFHLDDHLMVHAGQTPTDAKGYLFTYGERVPACFFRPYCRVEPCTHEGHTYTINGTDANGTHTLRCTHCLDRTEEKHTFEGGVCTVCGVGGAISTVSIYLPEREGDTYTDGHYATEPRTQQLVTGTTISMPAPPVTYLPNGVKFAGWAVGTPTGLGITSFWKGDDEQVVTAGTSYTVSGDVSLTARYQAVSVTLADAADNGAVLYQHDGMKTQKVTLAGRTLYKDGSWNTLCLPFNLTLSGSPLDGDGMDVRTLSASSFNGKGTLTLTFTDVSDEITAGTPFIIRWDNTGGTLTEDDLVFPSVTIHSTPGSIETDYVDFTGIFSPEMIYDAEVKNRLYLGAGNTLYYPDTEGFTIGSCRAYFKLKQGLTAGEATTSQPLGIRAFALDFGDSEQTGIRHTSDATPSGDGSWYTLDGRRLGGTPTTRRLYIHDGKKVVIE